MRWPSLCVLHLLHIPIREREIVPRKYSPVRVRPTLPLLETLKSLASIRTRSFRLSEKLSSPNLFHRWSRRFNEPR